MKFVSLNFFPNEAEGWWSQGFLLCSRNKQEMKTKVAVSKFGSNHKTSPWGGGKSFLSFLTYSPSTSQLYSTPIPPPWLQTPKHITGAQIYISSQTFNNKTINSTTSTIDITQKTAWLNLHHRCFNQQINLYTHCILLLLRPKITSWGTPTLTPWLKVDCVIVIWVGKCSTFHCSNTVTKTQVSSSKE